MITSVRDIIVFSDMDGTLLDDNKCLSNADLETIRLFTAMGGHFSVATGRVSDSVKRYKDLCMYLSPSITCGGCTIFDFASNKVLKDVFLPYATSHRALKEIMNAFPALGVTIMAEGGKIYQIHPSKKGEKLYRDEMLRFSLCPEEDLPERWNKVLFSAFPELVAEVLSFLSVKEYVGIYFVTTDPCYLEMMPNGASKGSQIAAVCDWIRVPIENSIVIGNYFNDMDMMHQGGYSVAMSNAPEAIRQIASEITGSCSYSGVGQFLYKLVRRYGL